MVRIIIYIWLGLLSCVMASAQEHRDSVKIHFRKGSAELDMNQGNNRMVLEEIKEKLQLTADDSTYYRLQKVLIVGGASPEGSIAINKRLSEQRASTLFEYLSQYGTFPDSIRHTLFIGRDWEGLYHLAENDSNLPYRNETLALLSQIVTNAKKKGAANSDGVRRLQTFRGGKPYRYMSREFFPALRTSAMYLWYSEVTLPPFSAHTSLRKNFVMAKPALVAPLWVMVEQEEKDEPEKNSFFWVLKTNALYDLALVPNIGAEFYLGKNWSAGANWMYAWWNRDASHKYWRVYGGDLYVRKWFGKKAQERPLIGHHVGLYIQALTYDLCNGKKGYMGGEPGGNLLDRVSFGVGVEYGYSLPIASKLNLDFTIGVGYLQGKYHKYKVVDDCYVWQTTKNRKWFGPTKAEVSLVWLLGKDKATKEKGGSR